MKKLSILLVLAMVAALIAVPSFSEGAAYTQAPMLDALVESGELPPVEERLPVDVMVVDAGTLTYEEYYTEYTIGKYGGTLKSVRNSATWDGWIWSGGVLITKVIEEPTGTGVPGAILWASTSP